MEGIDFNYFKGPKKINNFEILEGPKQHESSTYFFNQNEPKTITTYTYQLIANKSGTFTLPAASVKMNGKTIFSKQVELKVSAQHENLEDVTFRATISSDKIVSGEEVRLTYTLNQALGKDFEGPNFIKEFKILHGPATTTSSSRKVVNGKIDIEYSESYTYTIKSKKPGVYIIPAATIVAKGKIYTSNELRINVVSFESELLENLALKDKLSPSTNNILHLFFVCSIVSIVMIIIGIATVLIGYSKKNKNFIYAGYVLTGIPIQMILVLLFTFALSIFESIIG